MDFVYSVLSGIISATIAAIILDHYKKFEKRKFLIFISVIIFLTAGYTSYEFIFKNLKFAENREILIEYREEILKLRADYESIDHSDSLYRNLSQEEISILVDIRERGPMLADLILLIDDSKLELGYQIMKYDLLAYIGAISSEEAKETNTKRKLIEKSRGAIKSGMQLINNTIRAYADSNDNYLFRIVTWIKKDSIRDRLLTLSVWILAIEIMLNNGNYIGGLEDVCGEWKKISAPYRNKYPLKNNPSLRYFTPTQNCR